MTRGLRRTLENMFKGLERGFKTIFDDLSKVFQNLFNKISNTFENIFKDITKIFTRIFGKIYKTLLSIGTFFGNFGNIFNGKKIKDFLIWIIAFIILVPIYISIILIRVVLPLNYVFAALYFCYRIVLLAVFSVANVTFFIISFLIALLLSIINYFSNGALQFLLLCQNSPTSWFELPNFHYKNVYKRDLLCTKPCYKGYKPENGFCVKVDNKEPDFCPNAEIMRIYTNTSRNDKNFMFFDYNTNSIFYAMKSPKEREKALIEHYKKQLEFNNKTCAVQNNNINSSINAICVSLDTLKDDTNLNLSNKDINKLSQVCRARYCDQDNSYPFCQESSNIKTKDDISDIIKRIVFVFICFMFVILLIIILKKTLDL